MKIDLIERKKQLENEINNAITSFVNETGLVDIEINSSTEFYEVALGKNIVSNVKTTLSIKI